MNISIGSELESFVQSKVESGDYASTSEVIRDGLRLLKERDRLLQARLHGLREGNLAAGGIGIGDVQDVPSGQ